MRFFQFVEDTPHGSRTVTVSEDHIRSTYYPFWKEMAGTDCGFEKCLSEWQSMNMATEVSFLQES